jgi:hypothetical protein
MSAQATQPEGFSSNSAQRRSDLTDRRSSKVRGGNFSHGEQVMKKGKGKIVQIPLSEIETDPVGDMLTNSESLKPYIDHYCAVMTGRDSERTLRAIAELPVEKRYLSRALQCLDWALADYDSSTVELDMPYMPDLEDIKEKLRIRLWQLRDLLATLAGK